jgi:hypothetical protein
MKLEDITADLGSDGERDLRGVCDRSADRGYSDGVSSGGRAGATAAAATAVALQSTAARERARNQNQNQDNATVPPEFAPRCCSGKQN